MRPLFEVPRVLAALFAAAISVSVFADEPKPVETEQPAQVEAVLVEEQPAIGAPQANVDFLEFTQSQRVYVISDEDLQKLDPTVRDAVEKVLKDRQTATPVRSHLILRNNLNNVKGTITFDGQLQVEPPAKAYRYMIGCTIEQKYQVASEEGAEEKQIPDGVRVKQAMPDSPAAAAGIQEGDIIVKVGDTATTTLELLLDAVDASEGKEVEVTLLREGEEVKVRATPRERPQDFLFSTARDLESPAETATLNRWVTLLQSPHVNEFHAMGVHPAIVMAYTQSVPLPDGLTVIVKRTGNHPAEITVEQGKNKWTVKETEIDKLPPDVVPHVQRMLAPHPPFRAEFQQNLSSPPKVHMHYTLPKNPTRLKVQSIPATPTAPANELKAIQQQLKDLQKAIDALEKQQQPKEKE